MAVFTVVYFAFQDAHTGIVSDVLGRRQQSSTGEEIHVVFDSGDLIEFAHCGLTVVLGCCETEEQALSNAKVYIRRLCRVHNGGDGDSQVLNQFFGQDFQTVCEMSQVPGLYDEMMETIPDSQQDTPQPDCSQEGSDVTIECDNIPEAEPDEESDETSNSEPEQSWLQLSPALDCALCDGSIMTAGEKRELIDKLTDYMMQTSAFPSDEQLKVVIVKFLTKYPKAGLSKETWINMLRRNVGTRRRRKTPLKL